MYSLLAGLQSSLKRQEIITDSVFFRIHCTFSTVLLITFSLIITYTQFVGQPIRCMPDKDGVPTHILNLYCWTTPTFTVPDLLDRPSSAVAYRGIGASRYNHEDYSDHQKHYSYYQWVSFVLLLQAGFFYLPKWLWGSWEKGFMKTLVHGLQVGLRSDEEILERKETLIKYLSSHKFKWYAYRYWFCELLCLLNTLFQLFLLNWFFNGDFLSYGVNLVNLDSQEQSDRTDHMISVFPRMTKCTFKKFGGSGSPQIFDSLCLLPLNVVNEKTYIFLWFWLILLVIMMSLLVIYRTCAALSVGFRQRIMQTRYRMISEKDIDYFAKITCTSNWWTIYMLGRNMDPYIYGQVIRELVKILRSKAEY